MGLSIQQHTPPSPQPPASPRRSPRGSLPGRRTRPMAEEDNRGRTSTTNRTSLEDEPFLEKKLRLGSQMAIVACKIAKLRDATRSPSPDSPLSSVDLHTPTELREYPFLSFPPTPPPRDAPSCIPVLKRGGADKKAAKRKLQPRNTSEDLGTVEMIRPDQRPSRVRVSHQPAPPSRTPSVAPKAPAPPSKAAPPNRKGPRRGTKLRVKAVAAEEDLQPFTKPGEKLSLSLTQLSSDDWEKKLDALKMVRALVQHHPALLQTKLHEVWFSILYYLVRGCTAQHLHQLADLMGGDQVLAAGKIFAERVLTAVSKMAVDAAPGVKYTCAWRGLCSMAVSKVHVHLGEGHGPEPKWMGQSAAEVAQTTNASSGSGSPGPGRLVEACSPGESCRSPKTQGSAP
ncbi:uncharacterized protein LOC116694827 [Etheostoma spectabile]|uniref:uncharacterized protein LOC116694827 n=1 Tax=Etheostoma spectabile TaxID=54343 RepID=UPI0013AF1407|nr:uncharacterized protein LOC116694827 [Etheostoma spectabile]